MKLKYILVQILLCFAVVSLVPSCVEPVTPNEIVEDEGDDEEDKEEDKEDEENEYNGEISFEDAVSLISEIVGDLYMNSETLDELASHLVTIKNIDGVNDAYTSGVSLFVETVHGFKMSWSYFPFPETKVSGEYMATIISDAGVETKADISDYEIDPDYDNICIAFQMCDDEKYEDVLEEYENIADKLIRTGASVEFMYGFDMSFIQERMTGYDVVILVTYGFYEKDVNGDYKHWVMLSDSIEEYLNEVGAQVSSDVMWGSVKTLTKINQSTPYTFEASKMVISEDLLAENIGGTFDETSFVFNSSGESLKGNDAMADAFVAKGAGAYIGYDGTVADYFSEYAFWTHLLNHKQLSVALEDNEYLKLSDSSRENIRLVKYKANADLSDDDRVEIYEYVSDFVSPLFAQCENIQQLSEYVDEIGQLDGVEDVYTTDSELYVTINGGFQISWLYTPDESSIEYDTSVALESSYVPTRSVSYEEHDFRDNYNNVCVVNQLFDDERLFAAQCAEVSNNISNLFNQSGFDVRQINSGEMELDFLADSLSTYDIIFMITHGGCDENGRHWITTGKPLYKSEDVKKYLGDFAEIGASNIKEKRGGVVVVKSYFKISEKFIKKRFKYFKSRPIIFNVSCSSLYGSNSLAEVFFDKGAGVYLGYDGSNSIGHLAGEAFFTNMLGGMTVAEAFNALKPEYTNEIFYNNGKYFETNLKSLYAYPDNCNYCISHLSLETLNSQIDKERNFVTLRGEIFSPVKGLFENYKLGFCYSITEKEPNVNNSKVVYLDDSIQCGKENLVLSEDLKDFTENGIYYYRFFCQNLLTGQCIYGDSEEFEVYWILPPDSWVNLGLSVEWAAWNVGANWPEEYGGYYAWGETGSKDFYKFETYKYRKRADWCDDHDGVSCWCWEYDLPFDSSAIYGTAYDVATVMWGGRMPTIEEFDDLVLTCRKVQGFYNMREGEYFIGPNGNRIFIPYSGYKNEDGLNSEGSLWYLWSGDPALSGIWASTGGMRRYFPPYYGLPVRAVRDK
jgi:hypothetical protein